MRTICYSGCANYVFVAGNKKTLEPGSFIAWHGDMEQKDFRELIQKYEELLHNKKISALNDGDKLFLRDNEKKYKSLKDLRQKQAEFYSLLGLNSEFGRIGQEPINYPSDGWTLTKKAMAHFGITNVEVPKNYPSVKYLSAEPLSSMINGGPLLILDIDESGKIFPVNLDQLKSQ